MTRPKNLSYLLGFLLLIATGWAQSQTTFNYTGAVQTYTVPAGAGGIQIRALGAGGGGGGSDASGNGFSGAGGAGSAGAVANAIFYGPPGTVINVYVGGGGGRGFTSSFGQSCTTSAGTGGNAGGSGGFAGGAGGTAGCSGYSGGGGGGGAASVVANASNVTVLIAGSGSGGQGGSWESAPNTTLNSSAQGLLSGASVGGIGALPSASDGGAGGGGGGGCAGGAGGSSHLDKSGTANGSPAVPGGSCPNTALVSNFSIVAGGGAAGGAGAPGDPSTAANGGQPGGNGSVLITPLYPTLGLVKSAPSPTLQVGQNSVYTLTLTNTATTPAYTATIKDQLPANLTYVSGVGTNWSCSNASGLVTCNFTGGTIAASGGTSLLQITATPSSNVAVTNYAAVDPTGASSPPPPSSCTAANTPSAGCAAPVTSAVGLQVSGNVYSDANHNSNLDAGESGVGGLTALFVKLVPLTGGVCTGPATASAPVNLSTGAYSLGNVAQASYCLILDNNGTLSDIAAGTPAGFVGTQNLTGVIQLVVAGAPPPPQNFGLYSGSKLSGSVFADTGVGAGTANNGMKDGTETGIAGVTVNALQGAVAVASASSDGAGNYTLWLPASVSGAVTIAPVAPSGYLATGGSPGSSGGTYSRPGVSYTPVAGQSSSGASFGLVPPNTLTPNGAQSALPGSVVFYAHSFQAGSAGLVAFSLAGSAIPNSPAWSQLLYLDSNCSGVLDAGEAPINAPVSVTAGQKLCLIIKQFVPAGAALGAQNSVTLSAAFNYTGAAPALTSTLTASDITSVGPPGELALSKLVSNVTQGGAAATSVNAKPADSLQYSLTAVNNGTQALNASVLKPLLINDATPAFTSYVGGSALCPLTLPAGLTCTAVSAPTAGAPGPLQWTFTGALLPGAQFAVTYQVRVDQ